jgi:PilZ domain
MLLAWRGGRPAVTMADKRKFPRIRRRLVIEFRLADSPYYGFTYNLSPLGLFVRSIRIPTLGTPVSAELHLPNGKRIPLHGNVVRSYRAPTALARLVPSGFGLSLTSSPEEYFQFLAAL